MPRALRGTEEPSSLESTLLDAVVQVNLRRPRTASDRGFRLVAARYEAHVNGCLACALIALRLVIGGRERAMRCLVYRQRGAKTTPQDGPSQGVVAKIYAADFQKRQTDMSTAYLGLGSNEGNRRRHLQGAVARLHGHEALRAIAVSPVYETEAHTRRPDEEQPPFLNAVLRVRAHCTPERLLRLALATEQAEGRTRTDDQTWQPRPLDVDVLAMGAKTRRTERLILPHPRLAGRRFVLRPWVDLAPNFVVPAPFDQSVQSLLDRCPDDASVHRTEVVLSADIDRGVSSNEVPSE